jgi:hypothetical protein
MRCHPMAEEQSTREASNSHGWQRQLKEQR